MVTSSQSYSFLYKTLPILYMIFTWGAVSYKRSAFSVKKWRTHLYRPAEEI